MAETATIVGEKRSGTGTSDSRRLRSAGKIPASLYGLGGETIALAVGSDVATPLIIGGANVVDVSVDGTSEKAILREVQWDTFLTHILHIDLQRIDATATLDVEVSLEIRGIANEGALEQLMRSVTLNCPPTSIPASFEIRVGALKIGDAVTVADLGIPDDCTTELALDTVLVRINEVADDEELEDEASGALEPEVIGRKADDEEE
jgi:large subunit ribosomal protein L25